jgi:hypothetical protein
MVQFALRTFAIATIPFLVNFLQVFIGIKRNRLVIDDSWQHMRSNPTRLADTRSSEETGRWQDAYFP